MRLPMIGFFLALSPSLGLAAIGAIDPDWAAFHGNPQAYMQALPIKSSNGATKPIPLFSKHDIKSKEYVTKKAKFGPQGAPHLPANPCTISGLCPHNPHAFEAWDPMYNLVQELVGSSAVISDLETMEAQGLRSASLKETPWSGSYWPIAKGTLGARYADDDFFASDWKGYYDFIRANTLKSIVEGTDEKKFDALSPAEKYDLLIGGLKRGNKVYAGGFMTPYQWAEGKKYFDNYGKVEGWMGICHGWAPASFMLPRPRKVVVAKTPESKRDVRLYPADLKGLMSYLWTLNSVPTAFVGQRCDEKNPKRDPDTGRVIDEQCFDTNPGIWHLSVVNRLGALHHSLVMDATYDYEVWNQPLYSYSYTYFNPQTGKQADTAAEAAVAVADFSGDKFKKYRAGQTAFIVGIKMTVTYTSETHPTHAELDSPDNDLTTTVAYVYDLELDANRKIIGGEWYSNAHPDFLWAPPADSHAMSYGDLQTAGNGDVWKPGDDLPAFWRDIAVRTAVQYGQPLAKILDALVDEAQRP